MLKPLVTVIIPNYNHSRFLEARIASVLNQTFQDFEIILMDDKSTDDSLSILRRYESHPKVKKLIVNAENSKSTFKQWNKGVREATGEYIWIAESDDLADQDFLKSLTEKIINDSKIGIVYAQSLGIDENDKVYGDCKEWTADLDPVKWYSDFREAGSKVCTDYLIVKNIIPNASAVLFRKEVFVKAGFAPEDMRLCGDWLMWARMLTISDLYYVCENLNSFRFHSQSTREVETLERIKNKVKEDLRVITYIRQQHEVPYEKWKAALHKIMTEWTVFFQHHKKKISSIGQLSYIFSEYNLSFAGNYLPFLLSYGKRKLFKKN
jgi:glycosyltransferase involved in cell wall biosynthesis